MEKRIIIEIELPPNPRAMFPNFRRVRVFFARHMPGFFKQRHIDHRGGIALRAGITVPVPRPAKVAAFFNYSDIINAGLLQPCTRYQPSKTATNKSKSDMVRLWRALLHRRVGINDQVLQL